MADAPTQTVGVQISGGFRIETTLGEIIVTKSLPPKNTRYTAYVVLGCTFLILLASGDRYLPAILFVIVVGRFALARTHNLRCTHENLQIIDIAHGHTKQTRTFPRAEVKKVRFGAVSYSSYGAICGLVFTVSGKDTKALYSLKCVEAQQILSEIQRLGYDVERDPAMPMMVEMELSRRKSWFWKLLGN